MFAALAAVMNPAKARVERYLVRPCTRYLVISPVGRHTYDFRRINCTLSRIKPKEFRRNRYDAISTAKNFNAFRRLDELGQQTSASSMLSCRRYEQIPQPSKKRWIPNTGVSPGRLAKTGERIRRMPRHRTTACSVTVVAPVRSASATCACGGRRKLRKIESLTSLQGFLV
jgi:hypothetical protein